MNPTLLRASADAMTQDGDPRFYLLGLLLDDLADEVEAGVWPDSRTSTEGKTGEAA